MRTRTTLLVVSYAILAGCGSSSSSPSAPGGDTGTSPPAGAGTQGQSGSDAGASPGHDAGVAATPDAGDAGATGDAGALAAFNPPYPRVASYRIGGSQQYGAAFQAWAANQALVIIGGDWEGWNSGGNDREKVVESIKSQSTMGTLVLQYNDSDAIDYVTPNQPTWKAQVDQNNWYLWAQGASGTHVTNSFSPDYWQTNETDYVSSDAHGHKLEDAFAIYVDAEYRTGGTTNAAKSLDGHYHDNVLFVSREDGDFDRAGTTEHAADFAADWRKGLRRYFDQLAAIDPNVIRFGNIDDMYTLGVTDPTDTAAAAPLDGVMHGALLEGFAGKSWATETWAGWESAMNEYRFRLNMCIAPKLAVAGHMDVAQNGSDPYDATPYRAVRYVMASVALEDGYYAFGPDDYADDNLYSFDELGGNPGGPPVGYLGYPTVSPPTAAWQNGVWRRDFDHGIVLVNPKGNGAQTVSLGGTFRHLTGAQNPSLNDGSSVTSVTLADRDGLVLLR